MQVSAIAFYSRRLIPCVLFSTLPPPYYTLLPSNTWTVSSLKKIESGNAIVCVCTCLTFPLVVSTQGARLLLQMLLLLTDLCAHTSRGPVRAAWGRSLGWGHCVKGERCVQPPAPPHGRVASASHHSSAPRPRLTNRAVERPRLFPPSYI